MAAKKWYANVYILLMILVSCVAVAMAGLMFLLLPQSSEIISLMQWRMVRTKSFGVTADLTYTGQFETKDENNMVKRSDEAVSLHSSGAVDRWDPQQDKIEQTFSLSVGAGQPTRDFAGKYLRAGGADFVNFSTMPDKLGALTLAPYADKWLTFDLDRIRADINVPFFGGEGKKLDELDAQYLLDQFRTTPFLAFLGQLRSGTVGNTPVYHYAVRPQLIFIENYLVQAEQLRLGRDLNTQEDDAVKTFFANVTPEDGELWIGQKDYYLRQASFRFHYDDGARKGTLTLTLNFSDFNVRPAVTAPTEGVQDINDILISLLPSVAEHLPLAGPGAVRQIQPGEKTAVKGLPITMPEVGTADSDKDGLSDTLEAFYGTDPHNPDTDGDGLSDGYEVDHGLNPNGPGKLFDFGLPFNK